MNTALRDAKARRLVFGVLLVCLAAPGCMSRNVESLSAEERAEMPAPPEPKPPEERAASVVEVPGIDVTVELDAALGGSAPPGVLYLIVRVSGRAGGPPLAVTQFEAQFPAELRITEANSMIPGTPFVGDLDVIARLDQDGNAFSHQDGDLEGRAGPTQVGGNVRIALGLAPAPDSASQ